MRIPLADWRTNIDGGFCSYKLTDEQVGIARETAISFPECRLTAVDMLPSGKVFEINANAGTLGLPDEDRVVLAKKVLNKLEEELKDKELEVSDKELLAV